MLCLKRWVVPTSLLDVLLVELIYPAMQIACADKIALVSATLMNIHYGLRRITTHHCTISKTLPRIDMAYAS